MCACIACESIHKEVGRQVRWRKIRHMPPVSFGASEEQEGASRSRQGTNALEDRAGMAYCGDAKHEQASSLSHEKVATPPRRAKGKEKKILTPMNHYNEL